MKNKSFLKKFRVGIFFIIFIPIIFLEMYNAWGNTFLKVNIISSEDGIYVTLDSLRLNATFLSNDYPPVETDTSFLMSPTSSVWDTTITWSVGTDVAVLQNYIYWYGVNPVYIDDYTILRLDSSNFTDNVSFSSSGSGSGANVVTIVSSDSSQTPHTAVEYVKTQVKNVSTGIVVGNQTSDANGETEWNLDNGSYEVKMRLAMNWFDYDTITVSAVQTDTVFGYSQSIPAPVSSDMGTVYLVFTPNGVDPIQGAKLIVSNEETATDTVNNQIIGPIYKFGYTNALGIATVTVPGSEVYNDSLLSVYNIRLKYRGKTVAHWDNYYINRGVSQRLDIE